MAFYDYGSFVQELLKWLIFGIKAAHVLDSGTTSSASITIMKILSYQLASEPNVRFANDDVYVFAENTRRTGKTRRAKENGTTPLSVATNVVLSSQIPLLSFTQFHNYVQAFGRNHVTKVLTIKFLI